MTISTTTADEVDYAVLTEYSPDNKLMTGGWNTRIFTDAKGRSKSIRYNDRTGVITILSPGTYHITGMSLVVYNTGNEPNEMMTVRAPASAGYCRLRTLPSDSKVGNDDPHIVCLGSLSNADSTPSLFEAYFEYTGDKSLEMLLEHQVGSNPQQVYLRVYVEKSPWHIMSRIAFRKLPGLPPSAARQA